MRTLRFVLLACLLIVPLGCLHLGKVPAALGYEKVTKAQAELVAAQHDADARLAAIQSQIEVQRQALVITWKAEVQESSNHLFVSQMAFNIDPTPGPNELIMHEEDVAASLTLPPPDAVTIARAMDQVKKLLVDKQHLIDNLSLAATQAKAKADQLTAQEKTEQTTITTLTTQKAQVEKDRDTKVADAQTKLNVANQTALSKAKELLSNKAQIDAVKLRLTIAAAILAALFTAAAVFSPLMKTQLTELAVIFGGVAIAIPFVQAWMVAAGLGVLLLAVAWHFVATHTKVVNSIPDPAPTPVVVTTASTAAPVAPAKT